MKKPQRLFDICHNDDKNVSLSYQRVTFYSVEIYIGYKSNYKNFFYSDGHLTVKSAAKAGIKFMKKYIKNRNN